MMADIRYSLRHAFLAYPPRLVSVLLEDLSLSFQSQTTMWTKCLNISAEDILIDRCSLQWDSAYMANKAYEPVFYLAVDHKRKKIVLSIRGTVSIGDVLTDLNIDSEKEEICGITGYVFDGMYRGAQFVHKSVTNTLLDACKQYNEYRVLITGHSLGAGAAAFLGLMYKDDPVIRGQHGQRLRVWCFASPHIVSRAFTDQQLGMDFITTVNLDTDVVTRGDQESIRIWNLRLELIAEHSRERIESMLQRDEILDGDGSAKLLRILKNVRSPNPERELFPIGKILWFVPSIVLGDDIALRRKTLIKLSEDHDDYVSDDDDNEHNTIGHHINSDDEKEDNDTFTVYQIRKRPKDQSSDEDDDDAVPLNLANENDGDHVVQVSTENDQQQTEDDEDAKPILDDIMESAKEAASTVQKALYLKVDSPIRHQLESGGYVLCDATKCREIFKEFIFENKAVDLHMGAPYMWACGATLKIED